MPDSNGGVSEINAQHHTSAQRRDWLDEQKRN